MVRHRLKRQIREIYRRWQGRRSLHALDIVVHLRPIAAEAAFASIEADLEAALFRLPMARGTET